ncbi:MAG: hypothetical protein M3459_05210 [Actinomycetota bacterium]|nr:hypothetical protein [Actinomycetota bacterium]
MALESFPPERPFGRSEGEHDEVRGYGLLGAVEDDAAVTSIDERSGAQTPPDSAGGTDAAA